jgi:hypothetical protein
VALFVVDTKKPMKSLLELELKANKENKQANQYHIIKYEVLSLVVMIEHLVAHLKCTNK